MTDAPVGSPDESALKKYRKGMKELGRSLLVLAGIQAICGGAYFSLTLDPLFFIILAIMSMTQILMGVLLLRRHAWVNYFVAIWGAFLLVGTFVSIGTPPMRREYQIMLGPCVGMFIAASLVYYSTQNILARRRLRAVKIDPDKEPT